MYIRRVIHHPAPGKATQLRDAIEQRCKTGNAGGTPHSLTQRLYTEDVVFVTAIRHEHLADIEDYAAAAPNDPVRQAEVAKINECITPPTSSELLEVLVPAEATGNATYALRTTYYVGLGKARDLRQALEKWVRVPRKGIVGAALLQQVAPPDGATFTTTVTFPSLGGLEEFRTAARGDPAVAAFNAEAASLQARPATAELYRVFVPFGR